MQTPSLPTVLIVENEAIIRMNLAIELEAHGFNVLEAAGAEAAMSLIRGCPGLHGAVIDIGLDGEATGYDLVQAARRHLPDLTVIVASGQILKIPVGFDEHVLIEQKPYDPVKIAVILEAMVGRRSAPDGATAR